MKASLLFYKKFVGDPTTILFKLNTYGTCIVNKLIMRNQITVLWHVDDIKFIHESKNIVTRISKWLNKTYGRIFDNYIHMRYYKLMP